MSTFKAKFPRNLLIYFLTIPLFLLFTSPVYALSLISRRELQLRVVELVGVLICSLSFFGVLLGLVCLVAKKFIKSLEKLKVCLPFILVNVAICLTVTFVKGLTTFIERVVFKPSWGSDNLSTATIVVTLVVYLLVGVLLMYLSGVGKLRKKFGVLAMKLLLVYGLFMTMVSVVTTVGILMV
ncbi:hypothetical protein JW766_01300 [Candidatus Dojkabacteria bacterium]|nr:hypothetical protein [Candidatus Dojkabacteria bacterium]